MIEPMSPRSIAAVFLVALAACGTTTSTSGKNEPKNAKEKQALEKRDKDADGGQKWTGWRYQGDRSDCFYVIGRKCFKTQKAACATLRCKAPKKCDLTGGGPATVSCK